MAGNKSLGDAKSAKKDEFYTQLRDIEAELRHYTRFFRGKYVCVRGPRRFTNLDYKERHDELILLKHYSPEEYPKYDNFDAIDVSKTSDIPCDYYGMMGVPETFLDKYNPDQFEIIGIAEGDSGKRLGLKPVPPALKEINRSRRDGQLYFMKDRFPKKPYSRIIRRRR